MRSSEATTQRFGPNPAHNSTFDICNISIGVDHASDKIFVVVGNYLGPIDLSLAADGDRVMYNPIEISIE